MTLIKNADIINVILKRKVDNMDIISLSMSLAQTQLQTEVGTAVLDQSMNLTQDMSEGLKQMMEQSVTPYLGGSIDVTL